MPDLPINILASALNVSPQYLAAALEVLYAAGWKLTRAD